MSHLPRAIQLVSIPLVLLACGDPRHEGASSVADAGVDADASGTSVTATPDLCPNDPDKTGPGDCGCGIADTDSDGDETPDCKDDCKDDASKTSPGQCGCGMPDSSDTCGAGTAKTLSVYLMAGQSNMVGNVDASLFDALLDELESGSSSTTQSRLKSRLTDWYLNNNDGYASYGYSDAMATFESSELIRLKRTGLVGMFLKTPLASVMCAMNSTEIAGLTTNCGSLFGPELVLGHHLHANGDTPTSLIKVAKGGTTLYTDWRSPKSVAQSGGTVGPLYSELQSRIDAITSSPASLHASCVSTPCRWGGFIWFQGENDSMDQAAADAYAQNLENLIADVRGRVGASTLPVVIVEIGKWAQSLDHGATVRAAQRSVVAADANTRLVKTDDLSGFYHYDPAAQLIIGERVGIALSSMLP